jgi:hypothetical protein
MLSRAQCIVWIASLAAACAALVSCGGSGSAGVDAPPLSQAAYVSGTVQTSAGAPVAGATVSAAGQSAVTGSDGRYKFDASASPNGTVVLVKKTGFTTTAKEAPLAKGSTTQINITLLADQVNTSFSASTPADITVSGANVKIPANAVKTAAGADYTGTVTVAASYYSPDTLQGVQAFAGPYLGTDGGVQSPIISMGFMEVKLSDTAGQPLQLKSGAPATLTYPASSNAANAASIPMWVYDEAKTVWVREGQATRQADGSYQASVAHFSLWNADFKGLTADIKTCFVDASGKPIANVGGLGLRGTGYDRVLFGIVTADTTVNIQRVPANMPLELYSTASPASFAPVAISALAPGEVRQLSCISATAVTDTTTIYFNFPTTVFSPTSTGTATAAFAGTYTGTYTGAEIGTFTVKISSNGTVTGQAFSTTFSPLVSSVSGSVNGSGGISLTSTAGTAGAASFSGSISATGAVSGTWTYTAGLTGGGTFTGQRQ